MKTNTPMDVAIKMARALTEVAEHGGKADSAASKVLALIVGVGKLEEFNAIVRRAYEKNGWHAVKGRPTSGAVAEPVPDTVKTYVSQIRAAYKEGLDIGGFASVSELRRAVKAARKNDHAPSAEVHGVRIGKAVLTGSLLHDLAVVHMSLDDAQKVLLDKQLTRILLAYTKKVDVSLPKAA